MANVTTPWRRLGNARALPTPAAHAKTFAQIATAMHKEAFGDTTHHAIFTKGIETVNMPELAGLRREATAFLSAPTVEALGQASLQALAASEVMLARLAGEHSLLPAIGMLRCIEDALVVACESLAYQLASDGNYTVSCFVVRAANVHRVGCFEALRALVSGLPEPVYARAVAAATQLRDPENLPREIVLAYLFADEGWADAVIDRWCVAQAQPGGAPPSRTHALPRPDILYQATANPAAVRKLLAAQPNFTAFGASAATLATVMAPDVLVDLLGSQLVPLLAKPKYGPVMKTPARQVASALASVPTEAAARALAPHASNPVLAAIVNGYFRDHPQFAEFLVGKAAARFEQSQAIAVSHGPPAAFAATATLPAVLRDRAWRQKPKAAVARLDLTTMVEGEAVLFDRLAPKADEPALPVATAAQVAAWRATVEPDHGGLGYYYDPATRTAVAIPVTEFLDIWNRGTGWLSGSPVALLATAGAAAIPGFCTREFFGWLAYEGGADWISAVTSIVSPRLAPLMAKALQRKAARRFASEWLLAHAELAALGLVPPACKDASADAKLAQAALRHMAESGQGDAVMRAAARYGKGATNAVRALLADDGLALGQKPKPPSFLRLHQLPPVLTLDGARLADDDLAALVELLAVSPLPPERPYPGLASVSAALQPTTLALLAEALLDQWVSNDLPGRYEWMLFAAVLFPSETATRRMVALAREWARKKAAPAERLCAALAAQGSDLALMTLAHIAATSRLPTVVQHARQLIDGVAAARDLTQDELADRTVPDLGLSPDGTLELSFGTRKFLVWPDEHLVPAVRDAGAGADANRSAGLPRVTKTDDAAAAKLAKARFAEFKAELEDVVTHQTKRLAQAMTARRCWRRADFVEYLAAHPFMQHLARRLVWQARVGDQAWQTFRLAEDRSYADADDNAYELPPAASIALFHPADPTVNTARAKWAQIFADYELIQPFPQLGRQVFTLQDLARTGGIQAAPERLLGILESRGWQRTGNFVDAMTRTIAQPSGTIVATLSFSPGFETYDLASAVTVTTRPLEFTSGPAPTDPASAVAVSEAIADVLALVR